MNKRLKDTLQYIAMMITPLLLIYFSNDLGIEKWNSVFAVIEICMLFWVLVLLRTENAINANQENKQ